MIFNLPPIVKSEFDGYSCLVKFYRQGLTTKNNVIVFDFADTLWFDGNLCSVIGAITKKLEQQNAVKLINLNKDITDALIENGFLPDPLEYGRMHISANRYSSNLDSKQEKVFANNVDDLLAMPLLPFMSELLKKKINRSILEIFNNAINHGRSRSIFSCGQYYPKSERLTFTIVDLGDSIRLNVREYRKDNKITGKEAIEWAVAKGNTTRTGNIPGGLGFSLIRDFLKLNGGLLQVISSDGFWEEKNGCIFVREMENSFIGTIVHLEFNLNDCNSYALVEEIDPEPFF